MVHKKRANPIRWVVYYQYSPSDWVSYTKGFKTKKEAEIFARKMNKEAFDVRIEDWGI